MPHRLPGGLDLDPAETLEENEEQLVDETIAAIATMQKNNWGDGRQYRAAHAKAHGFSWGTFEVLDVPPNLKAGLFAEPGRYTCCVRTSSTPGTFESDAKPNVRGMAIKVCGVPGKTILAAGPKADEQDFLLISAEQVGFGTVKSFRDLMVDESEGHTMKWFGGRGGIRRAAITMTNMGRPKQVLGLEFFSNVPFRLGSEIVKYKVAAPVAALEVDRSYNHLRVASTRQLAEGPFEIHFYVQVQQDPEAQPVEDASVEWRERDCPPIHVATIRLDQQDLEAEGRDAYCEGLRFNPWHALIEHRPLGGLNRARGIAYEKFSRERLESHGIESYEADPARSDMSDTALPQDEAAPEARAALLAEFRERYQPDPNKLPSLVMTKGVPAPSNPSMKWVGIAGEIGSKILLNAFDNKIRQRPHLVRNGILERAERALRRDVEDFAESVVERGVTAFERELHMGKFADGDGADDAHRERVDIFIRKVMGGAVGEALEVFEEDKRAYLYKKPVQWPPASSVEDFEALYQAIPVSPAAATLTSDQDFARRRICGPNPTFIERISSLDDRFPVTDAQLQAATEAGDSLAKASAEGRLFLADYAPLAAALEPVEQKGGFDMRFYAPLGLFAVHPTLRTVVPVAIQCGQDPSRYPVVTPADGWDWAIAKTVFEVADISWFEPITHLALTHLMIEPVALATRRNLAPNHPVARLLLAHVEGTISVNDNAVNHLLADEGAIDQTFAASMQSIRQTAASAISTHDFRGETVASKLAACGLDDRECIPENPYRDDATRIWDAIGRFVGAYVERAYVDEAAVAADSEIKAWAGVLGSSVSQGGLNAFGKVESRADLTEVLTKIVYTASAGHAAVNFPQWTDASFAARMSGAAYGPLPPKGATQADYLKILPPLEKAELHGEFLFLLGTLYHTKLGHYEAPSPHAEVFTDEVVTRELVPAFQADLARIESEIDADNAERRRFAYEHLKPSKIPQSINV